MSDDDFRARRAAYTEAELYRIVAGQHLLDGYARDKAEFDDLVAALPESEIVSHCAKDAYSDQEARQAPPFRAGKDSASREA